MNRGVICAYLWLVNPTRRDQQTTVHLGPVHKGLRPGEFLWPQGAAASGETIAVPARGVVIRRMM